MIAFVVAVLFLGSGYVFLNVYTDYSVSNEKLNALKKQERFFRKRIDELNRQNKAVKRLEDFVALAKNIGVTQDRWDDFSVNLSNESMTFRAFEVMLDQTHNSAQYYFLPVHLDLRLANVNQSDSSPPAPEKPGTPQPGGGGDLVINLRGAYLIRN